MLKKLIKLVTNNLGLKIMALLSAVILWIVVVNINDPVKTRWFTMSVSVVNEDAITAMDKYYEIIGDSNTIRFQISAPRSVLGLLNSTDFQTVADLTKMEKIKDSYRVPIEISPNRYANSIKILSKNHYLRVHVEDLKSNQLVLTADCVGTPADNYALGDVKVLPNVIKISGPASLVDQVVSAKATIDVSNMSMTITDSVVPILYDADGNPVDKTKLRLSVNTVNVSAEILDVKSVEIRADVTGELADGYMNTSIRYSPHTVAVKGSAEALNALNVIVIPEGIVDINGAMETISQTVDISFYLPAGVSLVNNEDKRIEITVTIEKIENKILELPTENIIIRNLAKGYTVEFNNDTISLPLRGLESDLANLTAEDIAVTIDLSNLKEGEHTVTLEIVLDEDRFTTDADQAITLTIAVKEDNADNNDDNTNNGTNGNKNKSDDATNQIDEEDTERR